MVATISGGLARRGWGGGGGVANAPLADPKRGVPKYLSAQFQTSPTSGGRGRHKSVVPPQIINAQTATGYDHLLTPVKSITIRFVGVKEAVLRQL